MRRKRHRMYVQKTDYSHVNTVDFDKIKLFTWVISKVLHTVCFLFKNEFVLQNTFTGLQCNLHCVLSQRSNFGNKSKSIKIL
jgi:hypothetical protein